MSRPRRWGSPNGFCLTRWPLASPAPIRMWSRSRLLPRAPARNRILEGEIVPNTLEPSPRGQQADHRPSHCSVLPASSAGGARSGADVSHRGQIFNPPLDLKQAHGMAFLLITHDFSVTRAFPTGSPLALHARVVGSECRLKPACACHQPHAPPLRARLDRAPDIPIHLAAVNTHLCQVAGEVADGMRPHPICSAEYIANVMISEARKGGAKANRSLEHFKICHKPLVATADSAAQLTTRVRDLRARLAFYVSTPSYRSAVEYHGLGELVRKLSLLARAQEWERMP